MKPKAVVLFAVLAVLPLVLSSVATPFPETIRSFSTQTFKPVFQTTDFFSSSFRGFFSKTRDFLALYKQNQELKSQLSALKMEISRLREEKKKIERLQRLLPYLEKNPKAVTLAQIIFRGMSFWEENVVVDKGAKQGMQKDMPCMTPEGLVGRVVAVSGSTAHVMLLTDYSSKVSVLGGESRDMGLVAGEGKKMLRMIYIDLAATLKIGDTVVTSGMGGIYPKGIPVGKVEMVGKDKDGLHLVALVRPFVDFSRLEEVLCLARSQREPQLSYSS